MRGEEAIDALEEYIRELEERKPTELTERQVEGVIKLARGLISAIDDETTILGTVKHSEVLPKIKEKVGAIISMFAESATSGSPESLDTVHVAHYHPPRQRMT